MIKRIASWILRLPFGLILMGVALGWIARTVYPPPVKQEAPTGFVDPFPEESPFTDLPILP